MSDTNMHNPAVPPNASISDPQSSRPFPATGQSADASRGEDLDQLISKAQELVRNLDSLAMAAEPADEELEELPSDSGPNKEPESLAELDRALAADASEMLRTHASTVDAVLDHVFEERAAIVQTLNAPPPEPPPEVQLPTPVAQKAIEPQNREGKQNEARPASQTPSLAATPPVVSTIEPVVEGERAAPASQSLDVRAQPVEPMDEPIVAVVSGAQQQHVGWRASLAKLCVLALRPAIPVLVILNFPIRFVPQAFRPMVDWVALSLAVWVPIVWVLVLTLHKPMESPGDFPRVADDSGLHSASEVRSPTTVSSSH